VDKPQRAITSPAEYAEHKKKQSIKQADHELKIVRQMDSRDGRYIMMWTLKKLGYQENIVDLNANVYGKTAKQAVANDIVKELKRICPASFMQMEIEAQE